MTERLWAPWRIEYIEGRGRDGGGPCIFCDFAVAAPTQYREKLVLVVQPDALVCLNRFPFTTSHLLIAPRRHTASLAELTPQEYDSTMRLVRECVDRLGRAVHARAFNVGMNLGAAAGAGIAEHLHLHVVPRWAGDSNFMPVINDVRVMPQYLDEAWQRLVGAFADLPGEHAATPDPSPSGTSG
jgi:ATP adenylyltransferase